ncbi:MAG: hypothetical protein ISR65_00980 [Bacteriovoracaceae bacterium]|nr:hypothetical protein [Bacteriovoracaceae bacterium]
MDHKLQYLFITTILIIYSCASYMPEPIEEKISRFEPSKDKNVNAVPNIPINKRASSFSSTGRGLASIESEDHRAQRASLHSNKRLYFLTLLSQYNDLTSFVKSTPPPLNQCPHFHSSLITHKERYGATPKLKKQYLVTFSKDQSTWQTDYISQYPELSLPVALHESTPTVVDILKNKKNPNYQSVINSAVETHTMKIRHELKELCTNGVSDNYYNFENLVTFTQRQKHGFKAVASNMQIIMKTSVISNIALINSLNKSAKSGPSRGLASADQGPSSYNDEILGRLSARWAKQYFKEVIRLRE